MNKTYEELSKLPPIAIFEPEMDINEEEYITDEDVYKRQVQRIFLT